MSVFFLVAWYVSFSSYCDSPGSNNCVCDTFGRLLNLRCCFSFNFDRQSVEPKTIFVSNKKLIAPSRKLWRASLVSFVSIDFVHQLHQCTRIATQENGMIYLVINGLHHCCTGPQNKSQDIRFVLSRCATIECTGTLQFYCREGHNLFAADRTCAQCSWVENVF